MPKKYLDGNGVKILWRELRSAIEVDISDVRGSAEEAKTLASQAKTSAESAISSANTALENAQSAISSANTASENAQSAISSANTALENAQSAISSATTASENAQIAITNAGLAQQAATTAQSQAASATASAEQASAAAAVADGKAEAATQSARIANSAANGALTQLAVIEDVAGTLDWIQKHGTYSLTTDTSVQEGTVYFEYDSNTGEYTPIGNPDSSANPSQEGWYTLEITEAQGDFIMSHLAVTGQGLWVLPNGINSGQVTQIYILTTDTTVDNTKVYYSYNESTGLYTIVSNPDPAANPQEEGWYVLEDIEDARARQSDNYKILLSNEGMNVYDDTGHLVTSFGESITFDSTRPQYIGGENAYILFNPVNQTLTIGGSKVSFGSKTLSQLLSEIDSATSAVDDMQERMDSGEFKGEKGDKGDKGDSSIQVVIDSSIGDKFIYGNTKSILSCKVYSGTSEITDTVDTFTWLKYNKNGELQNGWYPSKMGIEGGLQRNQIEISPSDVLMKAIFRCNVTFA